MPESRKAKEQRLLPFLEGSPVFSTMPQVQRGELVAFAEFRHFKAGEIVFKEGEPARGGYCVATGRISMKKTTFRGKEMVAELLGSHDCFGLVSAAQGLPYPMTAQALRESVVLEVDQGFLKRLTEENPQFLKFLLKVCTERLQGAHSLIAQLADASSEIRIAGALLLVLNKFGRVENGLARIDLTRDEISSIAGTTVETCIRITRAFQDQGILDLPAPKQIDVLNPDALRALCSKSKATLVLGQ